LMFEYSTSSPMSSSPLCLLYCPAHPRHLHSFPTRRSSDLALAAARELRQELRGLKLSAGIGVAAGRVVAGHIGAHDRFEYTVIGDRKSTRLNSSHVSISYAVFCLKKKKKIYKIK